MNDLGIRLLAISMLIFLLSPALVYPLPALNPKDTINSVPYDDLYDKIANDLLQNDNVVTKIDDKLWVPWFKTSSGCQKADLQQGKNCNSGEQIDFLHNCMVTDEFSQVGIIIAMSKDQEKMNQFYNTVVGLKSSFGNLPSWRVYRNANSIEPCKKGINSNCDTASDANSRIIIALFSAALNPNFKDDLQKQNYLNLANNLASDMLTYETDTNCRQTKFGNVCNWLAGGSQVKTGGLASSDFAYTGYFADATIAMLMSCKITKEKKYCDAAKDFSLNYLQAANFDGYKFSVPPGKSFRWVFGTDGNMKAECTNTCNPEMWDFADAPRAVGMCEANYYSRQIGLNLSDLDNYCKIWEKNYAGNPASFAISYKTDGTPVNMGRGYYYQGLQSLLQIDNSNFLFKQTIDSALKHYDFSKKSWDNEPCFGVYTKAFAIRALGAGIGRGFAFNFEGLDAFSNPPPAKVIVNSTTIDGSAPDNISNFDALCTSSTGECKLQSDSIKGGCRTAVFNTPSGIIQIKACRKDNGYVEVYRQKAPYGLIFSACFSDWCVSNMEGFKRFLPF